VATIGQGLHVAGGALAQAIMQRKAQKQREQQWGELVNAMVGPEAKAETMPGYQQDMSLVNQMVPQAPVKMLSPMDPAKAAPIGYNLPQAQGALRGEYEQAAAGQNKQRELVKALLMSGSPEAEKMAYQMTMPKQQLQGAQRYMNLGNGKVLDMASEEVMDFSDTPFADPNKRFKEIESGGRKIILDMLPTMEGGNPSIAWQGDPKQEIEFEAIGAPGDQQQKMAYTVENGKIVESQVLGAPYSGTQKVVTYEAPPFANDAVFKREMESQIRSDMEAAQRGKDVLAMYRPEYQTIWGKAAATGAGWLDRVIPLQGEAKTELQRFAVFQRKVNENVNLYIKMITGAQMSEAEADRLSLAIANLTDSPAAFEAKLKDSIAVLDRAQKIKQETLEYYSGIKGMNYEKAEEYAEAAATRAVQTGMAGIGINWDEDSEAAQEYKARGGKITPSDGAKDNTPQGLAPAPTGWKWNEVGENKYELVPVK
jgi:hypothetical protein